METLKLLQEVESTANDMAKTCYKLKKIIYTIMETMIQIEIYQHQIELLNEVIQVLLNAQLHDKVRLSVVPSAVQHESTQHSKPTKIRTCYLERTEDNKLQCKACGRKLPSTHQGDLDLELLEREMSSRRW
jgi:hypothetical protein